MTVDYTKIRLGAPDSMVLDASTSSPIDLGASTGGVTFAYNATYLPIEIDQTILPASAFKTKEDIIFSCSLVQEQVSSIRAAYSLQSSLQSTVAAGTTASPSGQTVQVIGTTGATTYTYQIVPVGTSGGNATIGGVTQATDGIPSGNATTSTGNASLSLTNGNYNVISWNNLASATGGYRIIRTVGPPGTGAIGFVGPGVTSFIDQGQAATAYVASSAQATNANVDTLYFGGDLSVPTHTLDWTVPKNDGTANHWVGHLTKTFASKQVTTNWARDKVTELSKAEFMALADTTQTVGKQAGFLQEQR